MTGWDWAPIGLFVGWAVVVGVAGGLLTEIGAWYRALRKPTWQPPDWLFGPAWTLIFALSAWAGVRAWERGPEQHGLIVTLFVVNGALNIAWSLLFFRLRRPDWALVEVAPLWLSILALLVGTGRIDPTCVLLVGPYLLWVSFAAYLNRTIVRLNPGLAMLAAPARS